MKNFLRSVASDRARVIVLTVSGIWLSLEAWKISAAAPCGTPATLGYQVLRQIQRSSPGFTEGLVYRDGFLYESTGGYGDSGFQRINIESGTVDHLARLADQEFGEGLEGAGEIFYQLTWKEHRLVRWDKQGRYLGDSSYPYEGWGLTRDARGVWISSDGTDVLRFFDHPEERAAPSDWRATFSLTVMNGSRAETRLNELEFAEGAVFADIFEDTRIVRIDPASGCVTGEVDMSALIANSGVDLALHPSWVLNGIAYRQDTGTFFITGKNWPAIYEVRFHQGHS